MNTGFQLVAYSISLGTGLGVSGLHTFDSNQNGLNEIIFGSGSGFGENNQFLIAEYNQASEKLELLCQSERYDAYINNISPFANDSIATGSLIADGDGSIDIIDHETGSKVQSIQTGLSKIQDVNLGDLDNDGSLEIAILSPDTIAIYDANTYAFEQFLNYGGSEFALGHFTSTTKVQIAINSGYVFVLDNQRLSAVWDYSLIGFSDRHLEAGDIDNDGFDEIVAADRWYNVRVFNADIKGILWEHNPDADIDAVAVYDVTGDSIPEVIYGDGQWGNVYAFNGDNGQQLWSVGNPESGITDVLVGQLDDDDSLELLWGSGYDSTGPDYLFIHDLDTNTRQWKSPEGSEGGINSVSFGRLNADTIPDYIVASSESQDGDGILSAYNGVTNELLWQTTKSTFGGSAWTGIHDVTIGDINGDRINEVLVATSQYYGGVIYVLDASKGDISNTVALEDSSPIYSVRITNIDDDDDMEILAGGSLDNGELNGVYVIDGPTLSWEKNFPNLGRLRTALRVMEVVDIDLDNTQEIIGLLDAAYLIDPDNNGLSRTVSEDLSSLAVSSDTISGDPVVYVGGSEGVLSRLEADASLTPINSSLCEGNIVALEAISPEQLAFVCNGTLGVYAITEGTVTWITKKGFDEILGYYDRLQTEVVNGKKRILVGGSNAYLFEKHEVNQADNSLKIQVRALLQGAYDTGLRLMHRRLAENGFLPLEQPYADLFGHSGDESLEPLIMRFSGHDAAVDWVLLELREADKPANIVFSYAGILQRDGDIADPRSNLTTLAIPDIDAGDYYVSLRHRNHLGVMTAAPVTLSTDTTLIDFSNPATEVRGTHARKQLGSTSLLWAGDVNNDHNIIGVGPNNDINNILNAALSHPDNEMFNNNFVVPGYKASDLNMDGMTIHSGPNSDSNLIRTNVLSHPGNTEFVSNFLVRGNLNQ